jgi:transcription elongation factor GreA
VTDQEVTLMDAARRYFAQLSDSERVAHQAEVERFVRWLGADRGFDQLRGQEVANYAETLTGSVADASARAEAVRKFLAFAKKADITTENMGLHLRVKKTAGLRAAQRAAPKEIEMTESEKQALEAELEGLKGQRPRIREDLRRAMADKDFRENAPLDAARQEQAYVEGRIRELEATLHRAVIIEAGQGPSGDAVDIGSTVVLQNLKSNAETTYTLVRPGEANAAEGRISFQSPVGQALLGQRAGSEVEVSAPSGAIRFRIERVEQ